MKKLILILVLAVPGFTELSAQTTFRLPASVSAEHVILAQPGRSRRHRHRRPHPRHRRRYRRDPWYSWHCPHHWHHPHRRR